MLNYLNQSVVVLTGAHNTGKTFGALTMLPPSQVDRVYVHDAENSANNFRANLNRSGLQLGYYLDMSSAWTHALPENSDLADRLAKDDLPWANSKEKDSMIDYYRFVIADIQKNLTPGKYDVYVHDTIERLESGMTAFVDANPRKTGWKSKAYGEVWTKGVYPLYEAFINMLFQRGIKIVVFTTHLRTPWVDKKPVVGAIEPKGKSILYKLSQLYLWLVNDARNQNGEPAALVFKERLGTVKPTAEDTWDMKRPLPPRIPTFTWQNVKQYIETGVDMTKLSPREQLSPDERSMISTSLTDMQLELMVLQTKEALAEKAVASAPLLAEQEVIEVTPEATARHLYDDGNGLSPAAIAEQLKKPLPLVNMWLRG